MGEAKPLGSVLPKNSVLAMTKTESSLSNGLTTQPTNTDGQKDTANKSLTGSAITGVEFPVSVGPNLIGTQRGEIGAGGKLLRVSAGEQWQAKELVCQTVPVLRKLSNGCWPKVMTQPTTSDTFFWAKVNGLSLVDGWDTDFRDWPDVKMDAFVQKTRRQPVAIDDKTIDAWRQWVSQAESLLLGSDVVQLGVRIQNMMQAYPPRKGDEYDQTMMYEMMTSNLSDIPLWALAKAMKVHINTSKWRPTIAELRELAEKELKPLQSAVAEIKTGIQEWEKQNVR